VKSRLYNGQGVKSSQFIVRFLSEVPIVPHKRKLTNAIDQVIELLVDVCCACMPAFYYCSSGSLGESMARNTLASFIGYGVECICIGAECGSGLPLVKLFFNNNGAVSTVSFGSETILD